MRRLALEAQLPNVARGGVHVVLMDWHVERGTVTVVAAADGSASLYLSSGGGYFGGSEKAPAIRQAALHAVALATSLRCHFERTDASPLPSFGDVQYRRSGQLRRSGGIQTACRRRSPRRAQRRHAAHFDRVSPQPGPPSQQSLTLPGTAKTAVHARLSWPAS